ncbi:MAG TPA: Ig-like domain repeat protein [Acidobacteriaceae bacterium]|nr:Ig-like domain repeat protein [Acidobacteriaceae bacterium]
MLPKFLRLSQDTRRIAAFVLAAAAFAVLAPAPLSAQADSLVTNRLTQPIDDSARITLQHTVHPLANAANDRGAAPDGMALDRIQVVLKRSAAQESALKQLISDMHTPGTANYHKWLTPVQFGAQFGPSDQDIATVETWLQSKGFSVTKVDAGKQTLEMSGSVGQFRTAFNAQIHKYSVNGEIHYANATDPQIPAALAPVFGGFASLNNFRVKKQARLLGKATYDPKTDKATPQWTVGGNNEYSFVLSPGDYAVQYDLNPLYAAGTNGSGVTIGIINDSNVNVGLVNQFRTLFGLPANPPQVIIDGNDPGVDGINNPDGPNYDSVEAYLDVEWAGAVAPAATVDLVIGADTALESGLILAAEHAVYGNIAPVLSLSFGSCEASLGSSNQFLSALWEQAAAQGITVMVSTGDAGSAGCDNDDTQYYAVNGLGINGFGSTPYNVAVGGTDFYYSDYNNSSALGAQIASYWNETYSNNTPAVSIKGVIPEQPWNASQFGLNISDYYSETGTTTIAGGSGGASSAAVCAAGYSSSGTCNGALTGYAKPSWQSGTGVPTDNVRDIPDVSLFASSGSNASYYPECYGDGDCQPVSSGDTVQITGVGGTSASAPSFAGIMALVNQKYGRQGQADFVLYPLAAQFPTAFHDVTNGTNSVPCAYSATASSNSPNCIAVTNPITVTDPNLGTATEGQIGTGTTPDYNAVTGYDLATGLGTIDANVLVTNWGNVKLTTTGVTLTSPTALATFTHGQSVTFRGTVTGTGSNAPTGNVAIETDSTEPGQQGQILFPISAAAFSGSYSLLPGGTYNVWANYAGDSYNAAQFSDKTKITISPEASGIFFNVLTPASGTVQPGNYSIVSSGTGSIPYGTQLLLSALVAPSSQLTALENCQTGTSTTCPVFTVPTGTVAFTDGSTTINTAVLNAEGDAEFNSAFTPGSHSVTASYAGDNSYNAFTAKAISFTVIKDTPDIGLSATNVNSNGQILGGQQTVLTIQVENSSAVTGTAVAPTGTVTVSGLPSGVPTSATLVPAVDSSTGAPDGVATIIAPSTTAAMTYSVGISYPGDSNYAATSASGNVQFLSAGSGATSTTTATGSAASTSPNAAVTATVTVTGQSGKAVPTGTVDFSSSGNDLGSVTLPTGTGDSVTVTVPLTSQILWQGNNLITVQYSGDSTYLPSAGTVNVNNALSDFSMIPESTIVNIPTSGSATDVVNISSTNAFSGAVALTCTGAGGVLCSLSSAAPNLTSGGSAAVTVTLNNNNVATAATYNVLITGTDPTGEYVHTIGLSAIATATTLSPGLTLTGPSGITIQNPGDSGAGTLTLAPQGGLTGTASFTCSVANNPAGVKCSAPNTAANAITSTLTVATTSAAVTGNYTATVTATWDGQTATANVPIVVNAAAAIALANSGAITIASPGANGTSTISVTPAGGFTGNVGLTCSVTTSPTSATNVPTCSIASTVDVTSSSAATTALTVNTTAATSGALQRPLDKFFAVGGGIAVAGLLLFTIPARRRSWRSILGVLVFAAMVGMGIGCGGSSGSGGGGGGGGGTPGTTTGAYVVTVTGTDAATGKITSSTMVNVTVN